MSAGSNSGFFSLFDTQERETASRYVVIFAVYLVYVLLFLLFENKEAADISDRFLDYNNKKM